MKRWGRRLPLVWVAAGLAISRAAGASGPPASTIGPASCRERRCRPAPAPTPLTPCALPAVPAAPAVQGVLLQIFTKPLGDRPTVFFEIIQRLCLVEAQAAAQQVSSCSSQRLPLGVWAFRDHPALGACGGFASHSAADVGFVGGLQRSQGRASCCSRLQVQLVKAPGPVLQLHPQPSCPHRCPMQAAAVGDPASKRRRVPAEVGGCGGFGRGNFGALFKSIEVYETDLGINKQ